MAALVALALGAPATAAAVTPKFRKEFVAAKKLYDEGRFEEALAGFERARDLEDAPEALYSIARSHERLGHRTEAVEAYVTFLGRAPSHRGAAKARGYATKLLLEGATEAVSAGDEPDWALSYARASRGLEIHAGTDPGLTDATAAQLFVLQAEALVALKRGGEALTSYGRALGADITPTVRSEIERRMADIVAPPETRPESVPVSPESGPASAPASAPVGMVPESGPAPMPPPLETLPPARKKISPTIVGVIAGAGAGAVAIAVTATLLAVLVRPATDLGYFQVDFRK